MATLAAPVHATGRRARANGTDIHYVEVGSGEPLLLLHGGMVSTSPIWEGHPSAYVSHMGAFAEHFRVIAPDTRGHGRTANPAGGPISYALLADDILALIDALGLHQPMICGFSDGGVIAMIAAIRAPATFRALVNDAGFDVFDPESPSFPMMRQLLGGGPEATEADPAAVERFFTAHGMADFLGRMKADHAEVGAWRSVIAAGFERATHPVGHDFEDLPRITAPTLILTGDRDMCCSVEDAVTAYRKLGNGELAILPGEGHQLPGSAIRATIDFLRRHSHVGT